MSKETKELSKQLCELVKLTQKYALFGNRHTVATEEKIKEYSKEIDYPEGAWVEVYPDFGQPENFVKLQELMCDCGMGYNIQLMDISPTLLQIDFCWEEGFDFYIKGNTFQEVYLRFCEQICALDEDGNIKQSIREAEWKYE